MWLIIMALAIGCIYASLLYLFSRKYSRRLTVLLFAVRMTVAAVLVMLFVNPYIKQRTEKIEEPVIILAQDNSASITMTKDSVFYKEKYPRLIDSIAGALNKNYNVERMSFGGQYTNIGDALATIQRQYYKSNVGAVVLLSDGIVNQGVNPELNIASYPFPIYSVTLGDTVTYPGMMVQEVKYNRTVQANMLFPLRVTAGAVNCKGREVKVVVKMDGNVVESATMPATSNRFSKTIDFNIDSGDEGTKQLEIVVGQSSRRVFITVTDRKYRVLCLASAPHPDIAAIRSALDDHFEFDVKYDVNAAGVDNYDLLICHNVAVKTSIPSFTVVGTDLESLNESQDCVKIGRGAVNAFLDIHARYNNSFGLFTIGSDIKNGIQSYPPLTSPHFEMWFNGRHDDLLLMSIMDVETPNPLLAFSTDADGNKHAYLFGTGCWRWRLFEYFHHKNTDGFNEMFSKTIKYLLTEKDKELTVNHKDCYLTTESISLTAELRNPSRELVNEPDLQISVFNKSTKQTYDYVFSRGDSNYNLNIGMLPEGIYSYSAKASLGGIDYKADGLFTVESVGVEALDLTANVDRMRSLASQTGGKHYYITDIQNLIQDLKNNPGITSVSRQETRYDDLINLKWLFFGILGLITIEWLLRKVFGIY